MIIQTGQKKTISIRVRVTPNQYERILAKAQSKGNLDVSQFIRYLALQRDVKFETRFNDMYKILKRLEKKVEVVADFVSREREGLLI